MGLDRALGWGTLSLFGVVEILLKTWKKTKQHGVSRVFLFKSDPQILHFFHFIRKNTLNYYFEYTFNQNKQQSPWFQPPRVVEEVGEAAGGEEALVVEALVVEGTW